MRFRSAKGVVLSVMMGSLVLSGCQTIGGPQLELGSVDEACYPQRKELAGEQDYFSKSVVETAIKGAVGGAVVGGLTAALTGQSIGQGILIGVVGGAVAGAGAGYWNALQKQNAQQDSLTVLATMRDDIQQENARINDFRSKFRALIDCRQNQVTKVRADYAANRLTADQAEVRLAELKRLYDQDIALAREINGKMDERSKDFLFANSQVNPDGRAARRVSNRGEPQKLVATSGVNVRSGPTTSARKVSSLFKGQNVTGLGQSDGWWEIDLGQGTSGWVSARFLTMSDGSAPPATQTAQAGDGKPALELDTPAEKKRAQEVDQATLTNIDVRQGASAEIEQANAFDGFSGGLQTGGLPGRPVAA